MESMQIKINVDIGQYKKGSLVKVPSIDGVPTERYWRRRLEEAKKNNCVEKHVASKIFDKATKSKSKQE